MDGYNEIRDTIYNAIYICCPDKYAFPKHIMLGIVNADLGPKPPKYRHYFYPSPAVSKNKSYLSVAKSMFNRLVDMNNGFNLPAQPTAVRITPSVAPDKQMEWRAIPFYYKNAADLREHWSYYRTMRGTDKNVLSYHGAEYGGNNSTKNPLDYDLDKNNFFRIEGHQGKKMSEAMEAILDIRAKKGLAFDVVAVRMDENQQMVINLDDFSCQFDDLNAVLNAWIVEQDCLYAKSVKFFSSFDNTGKNRLPVKTGGIKLVADNKANTNIRTLNMMPAAKTVTPLYMKSSETAGRGTTGDIAGNYSLPKPAYTYQVDDTVNKNLFLEADTVGSTYQMLTQANTFMLADAYIGMFLQFADQNHQLQLLTSDQREIVYNIPVKLIARINEVTRFKPFEIKDLDTNVLADYKKAIDALCDESEASLSTVDRIFKDTNTGYTKRGYEAQYRSALVELTENCCAADKLKALMEEIESRKKKIIQSLSFGNYAAQHPGLEHKAGVSVGGTFVLLYATVKIAAPGGNTSPPISGGNTKSPVTSKSRRDITDFFTEDEDTFLLELVNQKEKVDAPETIKAYLVAQNNSVDTLKGKVKFNYLINRANVFAAQVALDQKETISNEMVVADFCIPYICCSDCPPMVFVMPKQKYSLALPKALACSDEAALQFQKEPAEGVVAASPGFESTIVVRDGNAFFDPAKVKEADFGKEITFTIDGQITDCSIKVVKHPTAKFSYKILNETSDIMVVQYANESDDVTAKQYDYEWTLGDGRAVLKIATKDPITITYNKSGFGSAKSFKVSLKANNGGCASNYDQTVPITAIPVKVGLSPAKDKVCDNDQPVSFIVDPANGVVKCKEVPGAIIVKSGAYAFNPAAVPDTLKNKPLHFTVNDIDVVATITVYPKPDAAFSIDNDKTVRNGDRISFDIIVKTPDADFYALEGPNGAVFTDLKPDSSGLISIKDMSIKGLSMKTIVTLRVNRKNSPCDGSFSTETLIIPESQENKCHDQVLEYLKGAKEVLLKLQDTLKNDILIGINKTYLERVYDKMEANAGKLNDHDFQTEIYGQIIEMFRSLIGLRLQDPAEQKQATTILRFIMMTAMNLIRCDDVIETDIEKQHNTVMELFMAQVPVNSMPKFFTTLDERDVLTLFINAFLADFKAGTSVPDVLRKLIETLSNNF